MPTSAEDPICERGAAYLPSQPWFHFWEVSFSLYSHTPFFPYSRLHHSPPPPNKNVHSKVCSNHRCSPRALSPFPEHCPLLGSPDPASRFRAALESFSLAAAREVSIPASKPFLGSSSQRVESSFPGLGGRATPLPLARGCIRAWDATRVSLIWNFLETERAGAAEPQSWPEPLLLPPFLFFLPLQVPCSSFGHLLGPKPHRIADSPGSSLSLSHAGGGEAAQGHRAGQGLGWDRNSDPASFQLFRAGGLWGRR